MNLTFTELDDLDCQKEYNEQDNYKTYYDSLKPLTETINNNNIPNVDYENNIIKEIKPIVNSKEENTKLNQKQFLKMKLQSLRREDKPKKKTISYDDILSSMNTVVIDGKLEFIRKDLLQNASASTQNKGQQLQPNKKVTFNNPPQQERHQQHQQQFNKNSYIYNKYFKDYKESYQDENLLPQRPLTKNELRKTIILDYANKINERNRISQIKSTKLLFTK